MCVVREGKKKKKSFKERRKCECGNGEWGRTKETARKHKVKDAPVSSNAQTHIHVYVYIHALTHTVHRGPFK